RVGGHGLSARANRRDADLRQGRGPVRPQDRAAVRDRAVPCRFGALRSQSKHDAADSVPSHSGPRRRRPHGHDASRRRRHRTADRTRSLSGNLRSSLRARERRRTAARRILHHAPELALDLHINLPFGILALFVLAATLPSHTTHVEHAIDYWGALTLAVFLTA